MLYPLVTRDIHYKLTLNNLFNSSSLRVFSVFKSFSSSGNPHNWIVLCYNTATVIVNWATIPFGLLNTGYPFNNSCFPHSCTANLAVISSSNYLNEKHKEGYLSITSAMKALPCFVFNWYWWSNALLYTVVLTSVYHNLVESIYLFSLSISSSDDHIQHKHIIHLDFLIVNLLFCCLSIDDHFVSIDEVSLHLMA